jgi:hypothetical protein
MASESMRPHVQRAPWLHGVFLPKRSDWRQAFVSARALPHSSKFVELQHLPFFTNPQQHHHLLNDSQDGYRSRQAPCSRRAPQYVNPRRVGAAMRWRLLSFRRNMRFRAGGLTSIQRSRSPPTPTLSCWCAFTSSWLVSTYIEFARGVCANSNRPYRCPLQQGRSPTPYDVQDQPSS